jgi:hypothetical protein
MGNYLLAATISLLSKSFVDVIHDQCVFTRRMSLFSMRSSSKQARSVSIEDGRIKIDREKEKREEEEKKKKSFGCACANGKSSSHCRKHARLGLTDE